MYNQSRRNSRTQIVLPWKWILVVSGILFLIFIIKIFTGNSEENKNTAYLEITPTGTESIAYISMSAASKNRIEGTQKLFATDKSVSVESGGANAENEHMKIDLDKNTELTYISHTTTGETIGVSKGRAWIVAKTLPVSVELKNFTFTVRPGTIGLVEQNNAFSIAYAITDILPVATQIGSYDLPAGSRIMIGSSDLVSGSTSLASLAGPIDESIMQNSLFLRNNGETLLQKISSSGSTISVGSGSTSSGNILSTTPVIEITNPADGTIAKTQAITVMGNILSKEVKRVTINDKDASVSPVNETFVMQDIAVDKDIMNLVYKAYDGNNSLMEKGVLVVFASRGAKENQGRLVSNNFPISNKDFRITFPTENPYKTTDSLVKVQGSVPKDVVEYIVVNDYRLQKFVPKSTVWYYFANTETKSMVDGINLYTIEFYGANDSLLYSQLFTIVKEPKNANVSGEIIR